MTATGLEVFDKTIQTTNLWLNGIGESIGGDKQDSYHALRAVLWTIRDRIPAEEAFHLSAQLPLLIRGIFWDGYRVAHKPETFRTRDEFLARIGERLSQTGPVDAEAAVRAVFETLMRQIPAGEVDEVIAMLPEPVRAMVPGRAGGQVS